MTRMYCQRCNDSYDEDNLVDCALCNADFCWKCGITAELPEIAPGKHWCYLCIQEIGRADLLKGTGLLPPTQEELRMAAARILTAGGYTLSMELAWKADKAENERLVEALRIMGMKVAYSLGDFEIAPTSMGNKEGPLMLTERGYDKLRNAVLSALS